MSSYIKINVFTNGNEWFAAIWIDGDYDSCDALDATTENEALAEAEDLPLTVEGRRHVAVTTGP